MPLSAITLLVIPIQIPIELWIVHLELMMCHEFCILHNHTVPKHEYVNSLILFLSTDTV